MFIKIIFFIVPIIDLIRTLLAQASIKVHATNSSGLTAKSLASKFNRPDIIDKINNWLPSYQPF